MKTANSQPAPARPTLRSQVAKLELARRSIESAERNLTSIGYDTMAANLAELRLGIVHKVLQLDRIIHRTDRRAA